MTSVSYPTKPTQPGQVKPAALPLGDGYRSKVPKVGYVDSCIRRFGSVGGSEVNGPWINQREHTWDYLTKLHVNGAVNWPHAYYRVSVKGGQRVISFDDEPIDHVTGIFPIRSSDPAYRYDHNGNHIAGQVTTWNLPLNPHAAGTPGCTGGGPIGVLNDGVFLYNALDGEGRDAGAHEVLDICGGHPDPSESYHHHDVPPCILRNARPGQIHLVGYALDGYGIYVTKDAKGRLPNNTQLDACHGTTGPVRWNGKVVRTYHYVATLEYPYTVGCYHGTPVAVSRGGGGVGAGGGAGGGGGGPPPGRP